MTQVVEISTDVGIGTTEALEPSYDRWNAIFQPVNRGREHGKHNIPQSNAAISDFEDKIRAAARNGIVVLKLRLASDTGPMRERLAELDCEPDLETANLDVSHGPVLHVWLSRPQRILALLGILLIGFAMVLAVSGLVQHANTAVAVLAALSGALISMLLGYLHGFATRTQSLTPPMRTAIAALALVFPIGFGWFVEAPLPTVGVVVLLIYAVTVSAWVVAWLSHDPEILLHEATKRLIALRKERARLLEVMKTVTTQRYLQAQRMANVASEIILDYRMANRDMRSQNAPQFFNDPTGVEAPQEADFFSWKTPLTTEK